MAEELPVVVDPDEMSDENFLKHWSGRHESLVGLRLNPDLSPGVVSSLRAYHELVHKQGYDEDAAKHTVVNGKITERAPQTPVTHDHLEA